MKKVEVRAQLGKEENSPSATAHFDLPESLAEAEKAWGTEVVFSKARQSVIIDLQALMRRLLGKGKSPAEIQAEVGAWQPAAAGEVVRKSAEERVREDVARLTPEQRDALLKQIMSMQQGQAVGKAAPAPAQTKTA